MNNMPTVMNHDFSTVPHADIPRSKFNRSHGYKTTIDADYLYPVLCDEVLPGDTIDMNTLAFGRINTPIFPLMDNIQMDIQYFFVPNRLVWDNWKKFMGEQTDPTDSVDFLIPQITTPASVGFLENSLFDYMGVPTNEVITNINALHARAFNLIWNEWYRDENLQDSIDVPTDDGPDVATLYPLQKRNKRHDYFTSCLPWPQKGDAVSLPLGTTAPITGMGKLNQTYASTNTNVYETDASGTVQYTSSAIVDDGTNYHFHVEQDPNNSGFPNLKADLTNATAATINELREAFAIQRLYERDARGGTRYTEIVKSHFNVTSPDARLQRPEYLGGGSSKVSFQEIAQTSSTDGTSPQGNMSAQGKIMYKDGGFNKSFTEHGVILGLVSIRADLTYQQGLNRMWTRQTKLDYYFPSTANLGEQAVLNQEIYADGTVADDGVFGYQERWAEMRYFPSIITGKMRSNAASSLDVWHLSQDFSTLPVLNSAFIEESVPIDRIVALPSEPDFTLDMWFDYKHDRPMPTYSVPSLGVRL